MDRMALSPAPGQGAAAVPENGQEGQRATAEKLCYMDKDVAKAAANPPHHPLHGRLTSKPAPAAAAAAERARYGCPFEPASEEGQRFAPPQLVWAKVRTHPWWPAQVVDPADASALALQMRPGGGGAVLVAFFSDKTFVWVPVADADTASNRLRAFSDGFESFACIAENRTAFAAALEDALGEVARRVCAGLSCRCSSGIVVTADGIYINDMRMTRNQQQQQQLQVKDALEENAGVRSGARGAAAGAMDAAFAVSALRGEKLVEYVSALAVAPTAGAGGLDLAVAAAQLSAFSRWRLSASAAAPAMERGRATRTAARKRRRRSVEEDDANAAAAAAAGRCSKLTTAAAAAVDALKKRREMLSKEKKLMSRAAELMSDCELM